MRSAAVMTLVVSPSRTVLGHRSNQAAIQGSMNKLFALMPGVDAQPRRVCSDKETDRR
jgi:hypothetical protein